MSNEIEATKRGVSVIIDGAIYELPILSAYDRADLLKAELALREKARADERAHA